MVSIFCSLSTSSLLLPFISVTDVFSVIEEEDEEEEPEPEEELLPEEEPDVSPAIAVAILESVLAPATPSADRLFAFWKL